jgi:hypothetical protein
MCFELTHASPPAAAAKLWTNPLHTNYHLRNTANFNNTVVRERNTTSEIHSGCRKTHFGGVTPD